MSKNEAKSGHPQMENEGKPLNPAYSGARSESGSAQQNGYDANVFGFRDGIVFAHGIRRG